MIFQLRDWSIMFQDLVQLSLTIFVFFKLTGLEAIEDHCEPETLHSGCRAAFAESVVFFRPLQSVAPQTSTCSCRKPLVQKLDTFHNEYLSAFYSRSRWLQNLRPLYFFFFYRFLFLFTRTEKRPPFYVERLSTASRGEKRY